MESKVSAESPIYDNITRGPLAWEELQSIFQYRDLIYELVRRDIVTRYKRSVLGIAWTMLNPLAMMIILTVIFSQLFNIIPGYPAYVLSGLIAWNFFSQTTLAAMNQTVWGSALMHRIYLPRTAFVVSAIGTGLVNLVLGLVPLLIIVLIVGLPWSWTLFFVPIGILLLATFALGIGLLLSALAVYFPDVVEMYQVVLIAWMYLTPIFYPVEMIPQSYRFWFFHLNPIYYLLEIFRRPIYQGILPSSQLLIAGVCIALATLVVGWLIFTWKADEFAYNT